MAVIGKWMVGVGFLLLVGLIAMTPFALDNLDDPRTGKVPIHVKVFQRVLGKDLRVSRRGVYGVDFLRCGSCRLEKMRREPFTFGGLNALVLEDLHVVLPEEAWSFQNPQSSDTSAREILKGMGVGDSFLRAQGVNWKFSGLRVERLEVSRLEGTNTIPFIMSSGGAKRDGLHLSDCAVISQTGTNRVGDAVLMVKPVPCLRWRNGAVPLRSGKKPQDVSS